MSETIQNGEASSNQQCIMIVDDERIVTDTLRGYLELETEFSILTFQSPLEALKELPDNPVDLVISDYLMPEMNGLIFLTEVKKIYPDVPRIILTAYADKDNAIQAINKVGIFQYVEKPWENKQLELIIRNALMNKSLQETLNDRIRELDKAFRQRDSLAKNQETLHEELLLARQLLESILPNQFPDTNGIFFATRYLPAMDIGGDFYDIIPLAEQHLAVLIADITGHGIKAALITMLLKFSFCEFENQDVSAEDILMRMNEVLHKVLPGDIFVAGMVIIINTKTAQCSIVNGGIPWPYLLHRKTRQVERVIANGLIIGTVSNELYKPGEEVIVELTKGDCLILYTDGLTEVENEANELIEANMLKQLVLQNCDKSGEIFLQSLIDGAHTFSREDHEWDDITILGIDVK